LTLEANVKAKAKDLAFKAKDHNFVLKDNQGPTTTCQPASEHVSLASSVTVIAFRIKIVN